MMNTQIIATVTRNLSRAALLGALLFATGCEVGELELDLFETVTDSDDGWVDTESDTGDTAEVDPLEDSSSDACDDSQCTTPPDDRCNGFEAVTFSPTGWCDTVTPEERCNYLVATREDCRDAGLVCEEGECVEPASPLDGELFLSEVMANPAAVTDTAGEWFEIGNGSSLVLDLFELVVDNGSGSFTIDEHILLVPGGVAVFGRNAEREMNGGVFIDMTYSGLSLTNSAGRLNLYRGNNLIDTVIWEDDSELEMPVGASLQRDPEMGVWCVSAEPWGLEQPEEEAGESMPVENEEEQGAGDRGTPGSINPPCVETIPAEDVLLV